MKGKNYMNDLLISIIVPIYNVEAYLHRCIGSLINQTYKAVEIILVDDGSTDSCGRICDAYEKKHSNIKVIHKENGGLSDARNCGFAKAKGKYILFVDSDDYIALDSVEKFVDIALNNPDVDMIVGQYEKADEHSDNLKDFNTSGGDKIITSSGKQYLLDSLKDNTFLVTAWSKMYRKDFLLDNELLFLKGIVHEDELFTMQCLLKAQIVVNTNLVFYRYLIRQGSIMTNSKQLRNARSVKIIVNELQAQYEKTEPAELKKLLCNHSATITYQALSRLDRKNITENALNDYSLLKKNSMSLKNKIRYIALLISPKILKMVI